MTTEFKLVPVEPTEEMLRALWVGECVSAKTGYSRMLAAAPTSPQPIYDEAKELGIFNDWFFEESIGCANRKEYQACVTLAHTKEILRVGWLACAQSRAKAGEVGHE